MAKKNFARTFGQDLMRGEHKVGDANADKGGNLTWVKGRDSSKPLDEVSRKILSGGRKAATAYNINDWVGDKQATGDLGEGLSGNQTGTSIFDPVLCELSYRWFCPPGGRILDPFAGGSVRGIVASCLGFEYVGVELRAAQVEANRAQARIGTGPAPVWHQGDSREIAQIAPAAYDMIFSCPPYADLEVYSDDPADLSTLSYGEFVGAYEYIIAKTCSMLRDDRFAVFVVGDVRDNKGNYYGFPWHTIQAFTKAGLHLYNEAVLVTAAGSLPIRAGKQFRASRKLGKTHQNYFVFCKGDGKRATLACSAANDNDKGGA
jgi:hypothetical protein